MKSENPFIYAIAQGKINGAIEFQIENLIEESATVKEKLKSLNVSDYPSLEARSFEDIQEKIDNGTLEIYTTTPVRDAMTLLKIIGTKNDVSDFKLQFWLYPIIVCLFFIVVSIITTKYWLLTGLIMYPLSLMTSTKGSPVLNLLFIIPILGIIILLFTGSFWATSIPISYILLAANILTYEKKFRELIIKRAVEIETAFLFLFVTYNISVYKIKEGKQQRVEI